MKHAALISALFLAGCAGNAALAPGPQQDPAVQFVRDMIMHHAQALEMTALAAERGQSDAVRLMAERIEVSQQDEIAQMRRWLERHGHTAAAGHAHDGMPGMLSAAEMASLRAAHGHAFDVRFLELMIRHHEGALLMVERLSSAAGGQEPELFQLVSHIDADQRAEIARMRRVLTDISN